MTHPSRRNHRAARVASAAALTLALAAPVAAQGQFDAWRRPIVVELGLAGAKDGERPRPLQRGRILLEPDESFTLAAEPYDQRGRRFPRDRFQLGVEFDRGCDDRLTVSENRFGELQFTAGRNRGRCQVVLYVPGNLNLDYVIEFEVTGIDSGNYTRRQAEEIADRLYRAILQRDLESSARPAAVAEIQRGRIASQVNSMVGSREFAALRRQSQPAELLEAFYAGLLQREPDSAGARDYLRDFSQGRYAAAIIDIVQSAEFEASLPSP